MRDATLADVPRPCVTDPRLPGLIAAQDWVLHQDQAVAMGLTRKAVYHRVADGRWRLLLPGVYLCHPGEPTRRQRLVAALLYAGLGAAVDADDACRYHGVVAARPDDALVRVVVPLGSPIRSTGFVVVRRTSAPIEYVETARLRYLEPAAAVIAAARLRRTDRAVLALLSDAVERRIVTPRQLVRAHVRGSRRNARRTDLALADVLGGVRSVPEADFRLLAEASLVLPPLLYNPLLRLPSGRVVSPDALAPDAGLVHEVNGRSAHARADLFDDMQERHDVMTEAGLTVLHNAPRRLRTAGREVLAQVERCYVRLRGRGLPEGVELLRGAAMSR